MSEFEGKIILVTGAGRGIGRATAQAFATAGAVVAANDITPINLDETIAAIKTTGGQVKAYLTDVSKRMPVRAMIDDILDDWGRLDVLINNAGVEPNASVLSMDDWDWQRTLDVNLSGPFYAIQMAGRIMREQGGGVIVNVGASPTGESGRTAFAASKLGLLGLTREAARELRPYNIRVNAICPAYIGSHPGEEPRSEPGNDLQPPAGDPTEAAALILFLCSREAAHISGQAIYIDGGRGLY
jgi:NAD(P)-dependent dehydrogenase (short-subunit alcohol dehydrogenase family)